MSYSLAEQAVRARLLEELPEEVAEMLDPHLTPELLDKILAIAHLTLPSGAPVSRASWQSDIDLTDI